MNQRKKTKPPTKPRRGDRSKDLNRFMKEENQNPTLDLNSIYGLLPKKP